MLSLTYLSPPHEAIFKSHCDHEFGGQVWFDVVNQMGGCPGEFVDAWNAVVDQRLWAVRLPKLDDGAGERTRDMPEPVAERPRYLKKRAKQMLRMAARLYNASRHSRGEGVREEIERLRRKANLMFEQMQAKQEDFERAATRPATLYTQAAWGARADEPLEMYPRALYKMMLCMEVQRYDAARLVDTNASTLGKDHGHWHWKGKGNTVRGKKRSWEGKWKR
jgi:hypothetical protein